MMLLYLTLLASLPCNLAWPSGLAEEVFYKRQSSNTTSASSTKPSAPVASGGSWSKGFQRAKDITSQMTLTEKVGIVTGQIGRCAGNTMAVERLGLPSICLQDGPAGPRPPRGVTQSTSGQLVASTWDRDLIYKRSYAMGREFYDLGVHTALAPVTGGPLGRSPYEGRNWEGAAADPYLTGICGYHQIKAIQDAGVAACSKHYIAYEQETSRNLYNAGVMIGDQAQDPIDSYLDDKTLHELYLWPFADAVRAGAHYVMCSYNMINGSHACADYASQNGVLKGELNFQGAIVSDWGAVHSNSTDYPLGGLDMVQPGYGYNSSLGSFWGTVLEAQVSNGSVPEARLDDMVVRLLTAYYNLGQADDPLPSVPFNAVGYPDYVTTYRNVQNQTSLALIKEIGEDGAVLLKNDRALPLSKPMQIAVIGADAGPNVAGWLNCGPFGSECPIGNNNGTLSLGLGSGWAEPHNLINPLSAIQYKAIEYGAFVSQTLNNSDLESIMTTALGADVAIVFVETDAEEDKFPLSIDRASLDLSDYGNAVINATASVNNNTIVVMHIAGPTIVDSFIEHENVTAVIAAMYPGEQAGNSIVSLLWGDVSPSGKLVFTIAKQASDYIPNTIIDEPNNLSPKANFSEGVNIDYRWFDSQNIEPRFEFGYGLSYSNFSYSNIQIDRNTKADDQAIQKTAEPFFEYDGSNSLYDVLATVSVDVKNIGQMQASEVVQLYVQYPDGQDQPPRQLRSFDKLKKIPAGSSASASLPLRRKDLSVWSTTNQQWSIPSGDFTFHVGTSSRKTPLSIKWSK